MVLTAGPISRPLPMALILGSGLREMSRWKKTNNVIMQGSGHFELTSAKGEDILRVVLGVFCLVSMRKNDPSSGIWFIHI